MLIFPIYTSYIYLYIYKSDFAYCSLSVKYVLTPHFVLLWFSFWPLARLPHVSAPKTPLDIIKKHNIHASRPYSVPT